ncbi:D-2-hydroxyacid dehydrogenase [Thalassoglobus polymorphus]|uniref:Glycerate dehydrogenase n=1 Tax=Thalassoglobus polymorphus TaxID=2527994 RepID=A0A517QRS5_9PLAN|nr:D-2-hydroxyacid dehydrogenase [Thalassoglobus polymorphus]QDT34311.1 Glycerate dehydrogenase [Thalassoglobus polymorphus]
MKIILYPPVDEVRLAKIRNAAESVPLVNCQSEKEAAREIVDATGFIGKITPQLLEQAEQLKWVQSPTASLEHYVFPELVEHPCKLSNMRGLFYDVIADHVFGYILCIARNLHIYLRQQSEQIWNPIGTAPDQDTLASAVGTESEIDRRHMHLSDCTIGVVGVGSIGAEICKRAKAFGMTVLGVDPIVKSVPGILEDVWSLEGLDDLLAESDFVAIAAPQTPATIKMFRTEQFQKMKPSAWVINIGRGMIIDLADLTEALQSNEIAGAALDVFEIEPLPSGHPLWSMENVIITPHVAAASTHVPQRHLETLLENVRRHVAGELPATLVDKKNWF